MFGYAQRPLVRQNCGRLMDNSGRCRNGGPSRIFDGKSAGFIPQCPEYFLLGEMFQHEVVLDAMDPASYIGVGGKINVGLVGEACIGHQRDIGQ